MPIIQYFRIILYESTIYNIRILSSALKFVAAIIHSFIFLQPATFRIRIPTLQSPATISPQSPVNRHNILAIVLIVRSICSSRLIHCFMTALCSLPESSCIVESTPVLDMFKFPQNSTSRRTIRAESTVQHITGKFASGHESKGNKNYAFSPVFALHRLPRICF